MTIQREEAKPAKSQCRSYEVTLKGCASYQQWQRVCMGSSDPETIAVHRIASAGVELQ